MPKILIFLAILTLKEHVARIALKKDYVRCVIPWRYMLVCPYLQKTATPPTSMRTLPHKFFLTPWEELQVQTEGSYSPPEPSITGDNCDSINTEYVSNPKDFSLRSCIWHLGHPKDDVSPQGWKREGERLSPRYT